MDLVHSHGLSHVSRRAFNHLSLLEIDKIDRSIFYHGSALIVVVGIAYKVHRNVELGGDWLWENL